MTARERPIIMSGPSVRAIRAGEKTQTRRPVKPQPAFGARYEINGAGSHALYRAGEGASIPSPFGRVGDVLWVKESCYIAPPNFGTEDFVRPENLRIDPQGCTRIVTFPIDMDGDSRRAAEEYGVKKTSSLFMPRWASRITLEIIEIRVEWLQAITKEDAIAEGMRHAIERDPSIQDAAVRAIAREDRCNGDPASAGPIDYYHIIWDRLNGNKPGLTWKDSPWVWVVGFSAMEAAR